MYDLTITPHPGRPWVGDHMHNIYIYIHTYMIHMHYVCMYVTSIYIVKQTYSIHHDVGLAATVPSTYAPFRLKKVALDA